MPLAFPAGPAAGQQYTGPNGVVYEWDNTLGAWVKVNAVQTSVAGAAAATSAARIPVGTTAQQPAAASNVGAIRYNIDIPEVQYSNGTNWLPIGAPPASLAEAHAGLLVNKYNSPSNTVPKDASGMTGSAYIPAGNTAQRPAAGAYAGQFRYNTQTANPEFSDGTNWIPIFSMANTTSVGLGLTISGADSDIIKLSVTSANVAPAAGLSNAGAVNGSLYYDDEYGAMFMRYNDGTTSQWVQIVGAGGGTTKLIFPGSPVNGQTYTGGNGVTYTYSATKGVWYVAGGGGGSGTWTTFTSSGTWTKPSGVSTVYVYAVGGGGGGTSAAAGGGGAGVFRMVDASTVPASVTVTVGAGGSPAGISAQAGHGGNSSAGTFTVAPGGRGGRSVTDGSAKGGNGGGSQYGGGAGGYVFGAQGIQVAPDAGYAFTGGGGGFNSMSGAGSWFGGGGGGTVSGTSGGASAFAGSGGGPSTAGSVPGGGGGGYIFGQGVGAAGARGQVSIMAF